MAWSMDYTPTTLLTWIEFYERMMKDGPSDHFAADLEVLRAARDLLTSEAPAR